MADTYTTRSGDTWDAIALRVYSAERYMDRLIDANPAHRYVAQFDAGAVLVVPVLAVAEERPASLPPWRRP